MTIRLILLSNLIFLTGCSANKNPNVKSDEIVDSKQNSKTVIIHTNKDSLENFLKTINPCDTFSIEFEGLYTIIDTLHSASEEMLIVDDYIKTLGFVVTSIGWGNWQNGPRVVVLELLKDNCKCKVFKKYFYNDKLLDGYYNLRVTEKLVCNSEKNAVD